MTPIESAAVIDEILGNSDWKDDLLARFGSLYRPLLSCWASADNR